MKSVLIKRFWSDERATLGSLIIKDIKHDPIFTLENPERSTTADSLIPKGAYKCAPYSGTHFKDVYIVQGVPGRVGILFHPGNYESDTLGCILLGLGAGMLLNKPAVLYSVEAFKIFRQYIGQEVFDLIIQ